MKFHVKNVGLEIQKCIFTNASFVLVLLSNPYYLYIPKQQIQMPYLASLWFQAADLRVFLTSIYKFYIFSPALLAGGL